MSNGRRELVEVTYRELRDDDRDGNLMPGRRVVGEPRQLAGGRVEVTLQWGRSGRRETARPPASRRVKVMRVVAGPGMALRDRRVARLTGGTVEVWDTSHADTEVAAEQARGHRWAMRCEHGTVAGRRTYEAAMDDVRDPRLWCVQCVGIDPKAGQGAVPLPL